MLGLGISVPEAATRARSPYAGHALALDFRNGRYRHGAFCAADVTALPGYSYSRAGAKWELKP